MAAASSSAEFSSPPPKAQKVYHYFGVTPNKNQLQTSTCMAHSCARIACRNVWHFVAPLGLEDKDSKNYKELFKTLDAVCSNIKEVLENPNPKYTVAVKTKIMLYALAFSISWNTQKRIKDSRTYSLPSFHAPVPLDRRDQEAIDLCDVLYKYVRMESVGTIPTNEGSLFANYRHTYIDALIDRTKPRYKDGTLSHKYKWICVRILDLQSKKDLFEKIWHECLIPVLQRGLYIQLCSVDHAVTMIDCNDETNEIIFRNTWSEKRPLSIRSLKPFMLSPHSDYRFECYSLTFVLPISKTKGMKGYYQPALPYKFFDNRSTSSRFDRVDTPKKIDEFISFLKTYLTTMTVRVYPGNLETAPEHDEITEEDASAIVKRLTVEEYDESGSGEAAESRSGEAAESRSAEELAEWGSGEAAESRSAEELAELGSGEELAEWAAESRRGDAAESRRGEEDAEHRALTEEDVSEIMKGLTGALGEESRTGEEDELPLSFEPLSRKANSTERNGGRRTKKRTRGKRYSKRRVANQRKNKVSNRKASY